MSTSSIGARRRCGGEFGAAHGMELPFVFQTLPTVDRAAKASLVKPAGRACGRIHRIWVGFRDGRHAPWPEFDRETSQRPSLAGPGEDDRGTVMPAAKYSAVTYLDRFRLDGRVAFVTGGASGHRSGCRGSACGSRRARGHIADRDERRSDKVRAHCRPRAMRSSAELLDVTRFRTRHARRRRHRRPARRIDILVNNAGIARSETAAEDVADEHWLNVLDVNLNGTFWCARAFGRHMLAAGTGAIVNVGSMSGFIVNRPQAAKLLQCVQGGGAPADEIPRRRMGGRAACA